MLQKSDEVTKMLRTSVQGVGKKCLYIDYTKLLICFYVILTHTTPHHLPLPESQDLVNGFNGLLEMVC
jgi:hypothetical protein